MGAGGTCVKIAIS